MLPSGFVPLIVVDCRCEYTGNVPGSVARPGIPVLTGVLTTV